MVKFREDQPLLPIFGDLPGTRSNYAGLESIFLHERTLGMSTAGEKDPGPTVTPPYGGPELLRDPLYNKGSAFTPRDATPSISMA